MAPEGVHILDEFSRSGRRKLVEKEGLARTGADQRAIGADHPDRYSQFLGHGQSVIMPPARRQDDLDSALMGRLQRAAINLRDTELRIQQGAIDVGHQQADREIHAAPRIG